MTEPDEIWVHVEADEIIVGLLHTAYTATFRKARGSSHLIMADSSPMTRRASWGGLLSSQVTPNLSLYPRFLTEARRRLVVQSSNGLYDSSAISSDARIRKVAR
jgi:hypothetical protein